MNALTLAELSRQAYGEAPPGTALAASGHIQALIVPGSPRVIAFRGTELGERADVLTDLDMTLIPWPGGVGLIHRGFWQAYMSLIPMLFAEGASGPYHFTGHSLGGALAVIAAAELVWSGGDLHGVTTFGQPRVGDVAFANWCDRRLAERYVRIVRRGDPVPEFPSVLRGYAHDGLARHVGGFSLWRWVLRWRKSKYHSIDSYIEALSEGG